MAAEQPATRKAGTRGVPRAVREQRILDVAGEVFASEGFHAASMDQIAAGADVTKPMLYAYFGSKQELYVAYIRRAGEELLARTRRAAREEQDPEQRLRAGTREFLRFVQERRAGWRVLRAETTASGGSLAQEVADLRQQLVGGVRRALQEGFGEETLSNRQTVFDGIAHAFVGAGDSLADWWLDLDQADVTADMITEWMLTVSRAAVETVVSSTERPAGAESGEHTAP